MGYSSLVAHPEAEPPRSTWDNLYITLQLFGLGFPLELAELDWRTQVARFGGLAVTASAFLQASAVLFREQIQQARLRVARDHVVVCGLGDKGWRLAAGFHDAGKRVVAIERDSAADHIGAAKSRGITVLTGDATDADLLAQNTCRVLQHLRVGRPALAEPSAAVRSRAAPRRDRRAR